MSLFWAAKAAKYVPWGKLLQVGGHLGFDYWRRNHKPGEAAPPAASDDHEAVHRELDERLEAMEQAIERSFDEQQEDMRRLAEAMEVLAARVRILIIATIVTALIAITALLIGLFG